MFNAIFRRVLRVGFCCAIAFLFFGTSTPVAAQCGRTAGGVPIPCPPQPPGQPPVQSGGPDPLKNPVIREFAPSDVEDLCLAKPTIVFFNVSKAKFGVGGVEFDHYVENAKSVTFSVKDDVQNFTDVPIANPGGNAALSKVNGDLTATLKAFCPPFVTVASLTFSGVKPALFGIPFNIEIPDLGCSSIFHFLPTILDFNVSPSTVNKGDMVTLDWKVLNAKTVVLQHGEVFENNVLWGDPNPPSVPPLASQSESVYQKFAKEHTLLAYRYVLSASCPPFKAVEFREVTIAAPSSAQLQQPP
ncbi:MAG: hypothetical protein HY070_07425, partial [Chloroflexi bacterium]|nr:hypothetical protein [Chloroflexota bacterium]